MWELEIEEMKKAAILAEAKILEVYASSFSVMRKEDDSPVTEADKAADRIIKDYLHEKFPDYAFLTEESEDTKERLKKEWTFIIDPIDGTVEFVKKSGNFSTNIALCHEHEIVASVIYFPVKRVMYYASKGEGAYRQRREDIPERIHCSSREKPNLRVLVSANQYTNKEKALIERNKRDFESVTPCGASLKFCMIAEGNAEIAIRYSGGTKEWDIASGDILLSEAGGYLLQPSLSRFSYNKEDVKNEDGYLVVNNLKNAL